MPVRRIVIDERYCRGDWSKPKSNASNTTISVDRSVVERIHPVHELPRDSRIRA
jgi:hypothetical protein